MFCQLLLTLHIQSRDMFAYLFSKNRGGIETAKFLSKLFSLAPQLVEVNAACNLMPIESLAIVCSALKFAKGMLVSVLLGDHLAHLSLPLVVTLCI